MKAIEIIERAVELSTQESVQVLRNRVAEDCIKPDKRSGLRKFFARFFPARHISSSWRKTISHQQVEKELDKCLQD